MANTNKDWRKEFKEDFVKKGNWYLNGWTVPFVESDSKRMEMFIEQVEQDAIQRTEDKWIKAIEALSDYDWGPYDVLGTINRLTAKPSLSQEELQNNLMTKL